MYPTNFYVPIVFISFLSHSLSLFYLLLSYLAYMSIKLTVCNDSLKQHETETLVCSRWLRTFLPNAMTPTSMIGAETFFFLSQSFIFCHHLSVLVKKNFNGSLIGVH